jgi:ABC-type glutathione transport system ATPase component
MESILDINGLTISTNTREIVKNTSFSIRKGDRILLSGNNGVGKSTVIKSILRLDTAGKTITGEIRHHELGDIFKLNDEDLQLFRAKICYVQQKDEFASMGNICVGDVFIRSNDAHSGGSMSYAEVNELIDEWIPRGQDNKRVFDAKSKPSKMSGGEQRLLSVLSNIATRSDSELLLIDEPLNNLDFHNAKLISNLINKVSIENSEMCLLMVSHCRIFPFINREIRIDESGAHDVSDQFVCNSCFGSPDEKGFY